MKQLIIIKPKSLSPKDKEKLTKAGNIVIEHDKAHEINYKELGLTVEMGYAKCASCGERIYMTKDRLDALMKNKKWFYCSLGHTSSYSKNEL